MKKVLLSAWSMCLLTISPFFVKGQRADTVTQSPKQNIIKVCDLEQVALGREPVAYRELLKAKFLNRYGNYTEGGNSPKKITAFSAYDGQLLETPGNGFLETAHWAYARHRSLTISPDMIWLLLSSRRLKFIKSLKALPAIVSI